MTSVFYLELHILLAPRGKFRGKQNMRASFYSINLNLMIYAKGPQEVKVSSDIFDTHRSLLFSYSEDDKDEVKTSTNQQGHEPFQSIPAQELLKDSCSKCGWIRKEEGSIKSCESFHLVLCL